ncbi:MAG: CBS domain-containing protein [Rhodocyclaceae bacterium]|nr:CBS domain-containing protein [Rhodocyclaceae bacterium]
MPGSPTDGGALRGFSPYAPVRGAVRRPTPTLPPSADLRAALSCLDAADAVAVVDPESGAPLGILTLRDVLKRVTLAGGPLDQPVAAVMTGGVIRLPAAATVHQASMQMIRRNVGHLVLVEADGRFCGIVAQRDLYASQGARGGELTAAIAAARDVAALAAVAAQVREFSALLLAEGTGAEALCRQISALNDLIGLQAIDLVAARHDLPYVPWCWLLFGSEGRLEQTLSTDQDNGLVFAADGPAEAAALRARFLPFARDVNAALDDCGFPLCKGNTMASNPELCLSLAEWKEKFGSWLRVAEPRAALNASIFFDLRPLYGDEWLAVDLQSWLLARAPGAGGCLRAMAEGTLVWRSPLDWLSRFRFDDNPEFPHTLDLKLHGVRPFVDGARIWSLAHGVAATNTGERLHAVGPLLNRRPEETAAFLGALEQVQRLRFANQLRAGSRAAANRVDPDRLNELDRQILKESLRQAKYLQQLLQIEFLRSA